MPNNAGSFIAFFLDNTVLRYYCHTNEVCDRIMTMIMAMILVMPNIAGSRIACFFDNTVPGNICSLC